MRLISGHANLQGSRRPHSLPCALNSNERLLDSASVKAPPLLERRRIVAFIRVVAPLSSARAMSRLSLPLRLRTGTGQLQGHVPLLLLRRGLRLPVQLPHRAGRPRSGPAPRQFLCLVSVRSRPQSSPASHSADSNRAFFIAWSWLLGQAYLTFQSEGCQ